MRLEPGYFYTRRYQLRLNNLHYSRFLWQQEMLKQLFSRDQIQHEHPVGKLTDNVRSHAVPDWPTIGKTVDRECGYTVLH